MQPPDAPVTAPAQTPRLAARLAPFGTTIFTQMTRLAQQHGAVNLAQGFPDFDGPEFVKAAAAGAMRDGHNQYARMFGVPALNAAIADAWARDTGHRPDPEAEITVTSGCTEAIAAALLGLVNPGDEVVLFEPFYDSYRAGVAMAGGVARCVALRPPSDAHHDWTFEPGELAAAFGPRTRAVLVNTPHNPTGKVFTRAELESIAALCVRHDAVALVDEVYERLVYEPDRPHVRLATLPGMRERTVTLSSLGKTFSLTGWKIGWAIAPPDLTRAVRAAHQFLTFSTATPFQHGAAAALAEGDAYVRDLVAQYRDARAFLCGALARVGLRVYRPSGAYFVMADHTPVSGRLGLRDDVEFCTHLTAHVGVAAIPPSVFYERRELGRSYVRFAFCKQRSTLEEAARRLESGLGRSG